MKSMPAGVRQESGRYYTHTHTRTPFNSCRLGNLIPLYLCVGVEGQAPVDWITSGGCGPLVKGLGARLTNQRRCTPSSESV